LKQEAVLQAAADGAVARAVFAMQAANDPAFRPDGVDRMVRIGGTAVVLRISSEFDRINPNTASFALMRALLVGVGVERAQTSGLAAAILDWRTAGLVARRGGAGRRRRNTRRPVLATGRRAGRSRAWMNCGTCWA
jgi:hypothetical protein